MNRNVPAIEEAGPVEDGGPCVNILLSTYNGEAYLGQFLESVLGQTYRNWRLYWRDDASDDGTVGLLDGFTAKLCASRHGRLQGSTARLGPAASFMTLLRSVVEKLGPADMVAFADQDDVWLPQKLARGVAALAALDTVKPALYCARQQLVDAELRRIGLSPAVRRPPSFLGALTQNIASGCTIMLNRRAAALVAGSELPATTYHDWWCYLLVSGSGGTCLYDHEPVVLYRQHGANLVGAPATLSVRFLAAVRRGPGPFMAMFRGNLGALAAQRHLLSNAASRQVLRLQEALTQGWSRRLMLLCRAGLRRQTWPESLLFYLWFLLD